MSHHSGAREAKGPFRADQLRPGDRYELSDGHAVYCAPTGSRGSRRNLSGGSVLDTDPDVEDAGVDTGYTPRDGTLRAPDVAVGNVPDAPGWVKGCPPLAVEYADVGQDEQELQDKIRDLLAGGTRLVWVVRLVGPRRVEVYEPGHAPRTVPPDGALRAPGILRNEVPVAALYDREAAHEATLRNLLQRRGYQDLDAVRQEAAAQALAGGVAKGKAEGVLAFLRARGLDVAADQEQRILACRDPAQLDIWIRRAVTVVTAGELFEDHFASRQQRKPTS